MHGPAVVSWLLALVCAVTGGYCLVVAGRGPAPARATARIEAAMGLGMAAMALPSGAAPLPPGLFVVVFGALAAWSASSAWSIRAAWTARAGAAWRGGQARPRARAAGGGRPHAGHGMHHTLEALAMVYMAVVMAGAGGGPAHGQHGAAGGLPVLTGGLLLYFAVFAVYTGARLAGSAAGSPTGPGGCGEWLPGPADACRLTLALGSFTMLLTL